MIEFICDYSFPISAKKLWEADYHTLLKTEKQFIIYIDNKVYFKDDYFPILEFLHHYLNWDRHHNFNFNTAECEDNPLISFVKCKSGWKINSVWKNYECTKVFSIEELTHQLNQWIAF